MSTRFPFMCLDLRRCALLCWSCARARALQQQTQIEWQPYRDSKVLNAVYGVLFWKEGPGTAEVQQDQKKIDLLTDQYFTHILDVFLEKSFAQGPTGLAYYVDGLVTARAYALGTVQQTFREASSINRAVIDEAQGAVQALAKIKLGSALVLTGTGFYLALAGAGVVLVTQVGLVKLGADVSGEIIKPHHHIGHNVKGVAYQLGKYGAEKGADKLADHVEHIGEHGLRKYGSQLASAQQRIERYSVELARRFRSHKAIKIGRRLEHAKTDVAAATGALKNAEGTVKMAKVAGKALPVVFAAWDVLDAWTEYREDVGEVR